ncbi:MAG: hypothetical protein Q4D89_07100 [Arachnia propionica]|uniref:hypothetical protein n=1 Tax=Arachnia propionica TaxID=1750 RepID=UPI0027060F38|nr:hypothetical protein [Arachnia propionica]
MTSASDIAAINLRLRLLDLPVPASSWDETAAELVRPLLARQRELNRRLSHRLPAVDGRIQTFLDSYLEGTGTSPQLPRQTFVLDQPGLARVLSLPLGGDTFASEYLTSYRLANGVLHNPANDRRTTKGVFHVAEGGLPIQDDKLAVPREVYGRLLEHALNPPSRTMTLPYTAGQDEPANAWVSLLLRPVVVPEVPGQFRERSLEIRFFAPGTLVSNLDFVEGIFGNGGDPYLPDNDASLMPRAWTGHTGAVILAPHLTRLTKKELGLPHHDDATPRQRRDGMCWSTPDELYNDGQAFKVCARDERGVIVTVIADNYFGYCKKEVKAQISYAANLLGLVEEEHAGGAICFPCYNLGQQFTDNYADPSYTLADVVARDPQRFIPQPEGHALDRENPNFVLVPERSTYSLRTQSVTWDQDGRTGSIPLRADRTYVGPDGYLVQLRHLASDGAQWTLIGTAPTATHCHKPATVSGGGKSEISKAITDAFITGNAYVRDFDQDMATVTEILDHDFSTRFKDPSLHGQDQRPVLSDQRSVGSVIKLLTPSSDYSDDYNAWLESIPNHVKELVFVVKRFYRPEWGEDWASHFTVGIINGRQGSSLRLDGEKIHVNMLRVGFAPDGSWRLFGLRHDFHPASKIQTEDDITASIVVPPQAAGAATSRKFVKNCENLLFQRPDDAKHRGYDKQAEYDIAQPGTFLSNFEPLDHKAVRGLVDNAIEFSQFSRPMQDLLRDFAEQDTPSPAWVVSSAHTRVVGGKRSKNPRYLQTRPDVAGPERLAAAELAARLHRKLPMSRPLKLAVDVVAAGRRNNAADGSVPPLCAYSPLHYMELPELFMEFISSMTGKSPSTTGAGSEGAMTKGPFNALPSVFDLNAAFLSFALTGYDGWLSSAGVVGPHVRVDHDISLLVPEVFARMSPEERDAANLIAEGCLERIQDYEADGDLILASRLGYRMTEKFASKYFGRIFLHPHAVFTPEMLRPELQDPAVFADSVRTISTTHRRVAQTYLDDGTVELAVPPVRALLQIMATGTTADGLTLDDAPFRAGFSRDSVLAADWYADRVAALRDVEVARLERSLAGIDDFTSSELHRPTANRLGLAARRASVVSRIKELQENHELLWGTIGRQVQWRVSDLD